MCNGDSHRPSYGGTIAILKPTFLAGRPMLRRDMSLHLAHDACTGGTTATVTGLEPGAFFNSLVVIHRDGDLLSTAPPEASALYSFDLPPVIADGVSFPLGSTLDLGVGGNGIIGRRVSFVRDRVVVGQGIIGWN